MRNSVLKKISVLCLIAGLLASAVPVFADTGFDKLRGRSLEISDSLTLTSAKYINSSDSSLLSENYYVYTPGSDIVPIVAFGNDIRGAAGYTLAAQIEKEKRGWNILGGTNGDFFVVATGIALGACIRDGIICSSEHSSFESIGFDEYGSAQIGRLDLNVSFTDITISETYANISFNKNLERSSGLVLYSGVYGPNNAASGSTLNVLVRIESGEPRLNQSVYGTVESVFRSDSAVPLDADHLLLCINEDTPYTSVIPVLNRISAGDEIEIGFTGNREWEDMKYVVGAEKRLLSGGNFAEQTATTKAPRTALGIKANGDVILYTADGRDSANSAGLTYNQLAQRMKDLGCSDAINLDGGGSTQLHCTLPGDAADTVVNVPSENRRCGNYIMFAVKESPAGKADRLYVYPYDQTVLAGSSLSMEAKAVDGDYNAVSLPGELSFTASGSVGEFDGNVFTAYRDASGSGTVNAQSGSIYGSTRITVVDTPDSVTICDADGKALGSSVSVAPGGTLALSASAIYKRLPIKADKGSFSWELSPGFGYIDEDLVFHADNVQTEKGTITVRCGRVSASIDVTVDRTAPKIELNEALGAVSAFISDNADIQIAASNISVTLDGSSFKSYSYSPSSGVLAADLTGLDEGLHHLILKVSDTGGNRARRAISITSGSPEYGKIFSDMSADHWAVKYAEYLNGRGVIYGKGKAEAPYFDPKANLTRQEFAAILIRWLGVDTSQYESFGLERFKDAGSISEFAVPSVKAAVSLGYISGKGRDADLRFDPRGTITRQEVIAIIGRALEKGLGQADLSQYSDAGSLAAYAKPHVAAFVENGIISGSDGRLRPRDNVTRAELSLMIYNCY